MTLPPDPNSARDAESALEFLAARAAHAEARTALELHLVVAARPAVKGVDEVDAHDDGAMDAQEALGIESLLERVDRLADEVGTLAGVELDVGPAGRDVLDLRDRNDAHLPAHLDGDPLEIRSLGPCRRPGRRVRPVRLSRCRRCARTAIEHREESLAELAHLLQLDLATRASERLLESLVVERLHEVVDGGEVERLERVAVVRGDEDRRRHVVRPYLADDVE